MKEYNIGEKIKELRLSLEISQNDLAKQICEPQDLEKIEKGDEYPTLPQLHTLAKRLGIPITYFFETNWNQNIDYINSVKTLMRNYVRDREYKALYEIVKREEEMPIFEGPDNIQFFLWHKAICYYHINKDKDRAIELLYKALETTNEDQTDLKEEEIQILHSIAAIHYDNDELEKAHDIFMKALTALEKMYKIKNRKVYLRILYGLTQVLLKLKKYDDCLKFSNLGIGICISEDNLYLFGEFYYQAGNALFKMGEVTEGYEYLSKSTSIFNVQKNDKMEEIVKEETFKLLNTSSSS